MALPKIKWPAKRGTLTRKQVRDAVRKVTQDRRAREAAAKVLRNPNSSKKAKTARGSALCQK